MKLYQCTYKREFKRNIYAANPLEARTKLKTMLEVKNGHKIDTLAVYMGASVTVNNQ